MDEERLSKLESAVARIDERTATIVNNCPACKAEIKSLWEITWKIKIAIVVLALGGGTGAVAALKVLGIVH